MKKLLAMIVMAVISLPALAKEVTLKCDYEFVKDKSKGSEIWAFDEAAGTVTINGEVHRINELIDDGSSIFNIHKYFITAEEVGMHTYVRKNEFSFTTKISRMNGDYSAGSVAYGNCKKFTQAF